MGSNRKVRKAVPRGRLGTADTGTKSLGRAPLDRSRHDQTAVIGLVVVVLINIMPLIGTDGPRWSGECY